MVVAPAGRVALGLVAAASAVRPLGQLRHHDLFGGAWIVEQIEISQVLSGDAAALAEFQRRNFYLAYVLECPVVEAYPRREAGTDSVISAAIVRDHCPALLRRIQFSYRPKQIALIEPGIPALAEMLRQTGLDVSGNATGGGWSAPV